MRALIASVALVGVLVLVLSGVQAGDAAKEVTLKGTITCAKCDLKLEKKCHTVIKTKDGAVYYFDTAANKKHHPETCQEAKPGSVTGVISDKDGKKIVTVKTLAYN